MTPVVICVLGLCVEALLFSALCWCDIRSRRIPNALVLPAITLALCIASIAHPWAIIGGAMWWLVTAALATARSVSARRALVGGGDAKLASAAGTLAALHPTNGLPWGLLCAIAVSGIAGIVSKAPQSDAVPFAPSIYAGTVIAMMITWGTG